MDISTLQRELRELSRAGNTARFNAGVGAEFTQQLVRDAQLRDRLFRSILGPAFTAPRHTFPDVASSLASVRNATEAYESLIAQYRDRTVALAGVSSDLESFRRLTASISGLAVQPWQSYIGAYLQTPAHRTLLADIVRRSIARDMPAVPVAVADSIATQIEEAASATESSGHDEAAQLDVGAIVEAAVTQAFERRDRKVDVRALLYFILGILAAWLMACGEGAGTEDALQALHVEQAIIENARLLELLRTRDVERGVSLRLRPTFRSRRVGFAPAGSDVIVMSAAGPWVRVKLLAVDSAGVRLVAGGGWLPKKYLGRAP